MALSQFVKDQRNKIIVGGTAGVGLIVALAVGLSPRTPVHRVQLPGAVTTWEIKADGEQTGSGNTKFGSGATPAFYADTTNGRVGVRTTSPKTALEVLGTGSASALTVSGLNSTNCDVKSTNGVLGCGTDATGGGGTGNFGTGNVLTLLQATDNATSTGALAYKFKSVFVASSTGSLKVLFDGLYFRSSTGSLKTFFDANYLRSSTGALRTAFADQFLASSTGSLKAAFFPQLLSSSTGSLRASLYGFGQGLSRTAGGLVTVNATLTGSAIKFTTVSGATIFGRNKLISSGTLVVELGTTLQKQLTISIPGTTATGGLLIQPDALASAGTTDSPDLIIRGRGFDTSNHTADYRIAAAMQGQNGDSRLTFFSRIDGAAFTELFSVDDNAEFQPKSNFLLPNAKAYFFNGGDANWKMGRAISALTKGLATSTTVDFITGSSAGEGIAFGPSGGNSTLELKNSDGGVYIRNKLSIATVNQSAALAVVGTVSGSALTVSGLKTCAGLQTNGVGVASCTSDATLKDIRGDFTKGLSDCPIWVGWP